MAIKLPGLKLPLKAKDKGPVTGTAEAPAAPAAAAAAAVGALPLIGHLPVQRQILLLISAFGLFVLIIFGVLYLSLIHI